MPRALRLSDPNADSGHGFAFQIADSAITVGCTRISGLAYDLDTHGLVGTSFGSSGMLCRIRQEDQDPIALVMAFASAPNLNIL